MDNKGHLASIARNQNIIKNKSPIATPSAAIGMSRMKDMHTSASAAMLPLAKAVTDDSVPKHGDNQKEDHLKSVEASRPTLRDTSIERSADSRSRKRSITPPKRSHSVTSLNKKNSIPAKRNNIVGSTKN